MANRRTTTKDVSLLRQLYQSGQLDLAPEYQRNSVWPRAAKAYLIDSILKNRPIPPLLMQRRASGSAGRPSYEVIDGQQRLRAVFDFLQNRFRLAEEAGLSRAGLQFRDLSEKDREQILDYDFVVEELSGYTREDIEDIFVRLNRFVVSLNAQEIRHAKEHGAFADFITGIGNWDYWTERRILTATQIRRMRNFELAAELAILLAEGAQDKKGSIGIWYANYRTEFPEGAELEARFRRYQDWLDKALPNLSTSRFRRPVEYYSLVGGLDEVAAGGYTLDDLDASKANKALMNFQRECAKEEPIRLAARYLTAASRQTDNIRPRQTRIEIISRLLTHE